MQVHELQQQNHQLVRNISCLFKTAQSELARKDREISQLRQQLAPSEQPRLRAYPAARAVGAGVSHTGNLHM